MKANSHKSKSKQVRKGATIETKGKAKAKMKKSVSGKDSIKRDFLSF